MHGSDIKENPQVAYPLVSNFKLTPKADRDEDFIYTKGIEVYVSLEARVLSPALEEGREASVTRRVL